LGAMDFGERFHRAMVWRDVEVVNAVRRR
jgi:hypothetical protein